MCSNKSHGKFQSAHYIEFNLMPCNISLISLGIHWFHMNSDSHDSAAFFLSDGSIKGFIYRIDFNEM